MSQFRAKLDGSVTFLFILGYAASKLKDIPFAFFSFSMSALSLLAYLIGYLLWYCAALFQPNKQPPPTFSRLFFEFKTQYQIAAILGIIACLICITCPSFMIIPGLWLFNASNVLWSVTEYSKLRVQTPSSMKQTLYMFYVMGTTGTCFITTIASTMVFFSPALSLVATVLSLSLGNMLTLGGFLFLNLSLQATEPKQSYKELSKKLKFNFISEKELIKKVPKVNFTKASSTPFKTIKIQFTEPEPKEHPFRP